MSADVTDNENLKRFELIAGKSVAFVTYNLADGDIVLLHTEVPQELTGHGVGSKLASGIFSLIRRSGHKAVVECPFLAAWARRHTEVADLIVKLPTR